MPIPERHVPRIRELTDDPAPVGRPSWAARPCRAQAHSLLVGLAPSAGGRQLRR